MQSVKAGTPGYIGITSGDLARFAAFTTSMFSLQVPAGSSWNYVRGNGFAGLRNIIVREMLKNDAEWLWFIDDDHVFDPAIILRLLSRNVDIIQPLVATRKPPFWPYAYEYNGTGYRPLDWEKLPTSGILKVDAVGTGGMLIRRKVLDAMPDPWFKEGVTGPEHVGEDLNFCTEAQKLGFSVYVDCDARMGHMLIAECWPNDVEDKWCIDLDLYHGVRVRVNTNIGEKTLQEV